MGGEGRGGKITQRNWPEGKTKLAARWAVPCWLIPSLALPDRLRRVRGRAPRGDSEGAGPGPAPSPSLPSRRIGWRQHKTRRISPPPGRAPPCGRLWRRLRFARQCPPCEVTGEFVCAGRVI